MAGDLRHLEASAPPAAGGLAEIFAALTEEETGRDPEAVSGALADLGKRLDQIGPVNMMALDQFRELEERHTFLSAQRKDLQDALASLKETIARINRTSRERFLETGQGVFHVVARSGLAINADSARANPQHAAAAMIERDPADEEIGSAGGGVEISSKLLHRREPSLALEDRHLTLAALVCIPDQTAAGHQLGREFPALTYTATDADALTRLEPAPRTVRGARDLLSVALQYGNAFGRGFQAAALKPADFFGNDDVLYLMEDMATGEIRLSILWEWLHKGAHLSDGDPDTGVRAGDRFTRALFERLLGEEYAKLLAARNRDVHDDSKTTTLPIAREIVVAYLRADIKPPWYIDLLNLNLDNHDLDTAAERIARFLAGFERDGTRLTGNLDFGAVAPALDDLP